MAHNLNMKVVTEGIETEEQSEFIKSKIVMKYKDIFLVDLLR